MIQPWITVDDLAEPTNPDAPWAVEAASWILFKLSGEKYPGVREVTEYYSVDAAGNLSMTAELINGQMHNLPARSARYEGLTRIRLRNSPVLSVSSVRMLGRELTAGEYQLRNSAYLVRAQKLPWITDPINEIEVTYRYGSPPPSMGQTAAIRLANEFIWNEQDSDRCTLPERISSSVTRQGVSYTILDPQEFIKEGKTGVYTVDMFLQAANPSGAKKKPKVFSPDIPRGERIR